MRPPAPLLTLALFVAAGLSARAASELREAPTGRAIPAPRTVPAAPPLGRPLPSIAGTFSIYFENDLFAGTDRYYTNGVKIGWSSPDLASFRDTPYASPLLPLLDAIPFVNRPEFQKNLTFSLGQNIYTPDNTESPDVVAGDRPYAGWLYGGFGLVLKNADVRHTFALNIGVVGSYSYAEEAQRLVHEVRDLAVPQGWDNQLHNEVGVVGLYEVAWRWPRREARVGLGWDFIPHVGIAVGNVYDYAALGGELRVGVNLPDDFGTASIGPGAGTATPVEGRERATRARVFDVGLYAFARAEGRAVARNIFLDGNTFGNSPSVDKKYLVADLTAGASMNFRDTKITYALVYRSEEFEGQAEGQLFGSITLNLAY